MIRHRGFDYGERNNGGVSILNFAVANESVIVNSYLKKKDDYLATHKSDIMQIHYILTKEHNSTLCEDGKGILSAYLGTTRTRSY